MTSSGQTGEGGSGHPIPLVPHPAKPAARVTGVAVEVARVAPDTLALRFLVSGTVEALVVPATEAPARRDGLWQTTCFELFARTATGYVEYNFSPSSQWAAYRFMAYREGMAELDGIDAPVIAPERAPGSYALDVRVALPADTGIGRLSLTAVIEETDGTKSYWAVAHPAGKPDFHDPACFVLELPAASAA
ncbi:DOMON-like domain-containing protein [Sphingomonas sp. CJ20]